jgi:hypothetical protein
MTADPIQSAVYDRRYRGMRAYAFQA